MLYGISLSATGAQIERSRLENASNNLANVNTVGFKQDLLTVMNRPVESRTWLSPDEIMRVDYIDELNDRMGGGVWLHQSHSVLNQGNPMIDDNPMHFAIEGEGFFSVKDVHSGETYYTRAGNFDMNSQGMMQTADGLYRVLDSNGNEINVGELIGDNGAGVLQVSKDGHLQIASDTGPIATNVKLGITVFEGKDAFDLQKYGNNLFVAYDEEIVKRAKQLTQLEDRASVEVAVHQGMLEGSGINAVDASREMIEVSRAYERHMNMMKMQNTTLETLVSRVSRPI